MSLDPTPLTRRELRERQARGVVPTAAVTRTIVVRRAPAPRKNRPVSWLLSMFAMLFAGALLVGMSVPANAFMDGEAAPTAAPKAAQSLEVSETALASDTTRSTYTITSYADILRARYGNRNYSYTVGHGAVQWPFPYPVPISDGFGYRPAPCRGCSTFHQGTDFTPGAGTAIYAIASGTVSYTEVSDTGLGNNVTIDHVINGERVQSVYGHMQMNSSPLHVGDVIKVGDFVGLVGETGTAIGAHLHLEIHVNGVPIDPYAWLKKHAAA